MQVANFGTTNDGHAIKRYQLRSKSGVEATLINYGAALVSLKIPDRKGHLADVVLGYDHLNDYEQDKSFQGTTIGRYGNRIANGEFSLHGTTFRLSKNNGPHSLHGGKEGFHKKIWTAIDRSCTGAEILELTYTSRDGEEGYPGTLNASVTYTVPAESNELRIDYLATTDKDTVVNLTNHSYFNLSGAPSQTILDHQLLLHAMHFTPIDSTIIPTGDLRAVSGTPFDFTRFTTIGERIQVEDEQLKFGSGYDHNWVLQRREGNDPQLAAEVFEPNSGRVLEVLTTEPGIQFYSGNFLGGAIPGKGSPHFGYRTGFCLETQHFPDSPNHPNFPSTVLKPGETYRSTTAFRFSTR
jgi:aldose 1-epimerase